VPKMPKLKAGHGMSAVVRVPAGTGSLLSTKQLLLSHWPQTS